MTDRVRMKSKTVFANERVTVFSAAYPEGKKGEPVTDGDEIETDLAHAKDLDRLGLAVALNPADLEGETRLEPGYQVSVTELRAQDASSQTSATAAAPDGDLDLGATGSTDTTDTGTGDADAKTAEQPEEAADDVAVQSSASRRAKARKEA